MRTRNLSESAKYVRVHRSFLRVMGLAMLTYFAFDLTDALTDFVSAIPPVTYMRLLMIPLSFYLVTGVYCLTLSHHKVSPPDR
jgi:muconolactone delta-isomerase